MRTKENNIREEAYAIDALQVSEQNSMDRKCMVIKMNVEDGTFSLREALDLYKVPVEAYLKYTIKNALSEVNSELIGKEQLSFVELQAHTNTAVEDYYESLKYNRELRIKITPRKLGFKQLFAGHADEINPITSTHITLKTQKLKSFFIDRLKDMWWTEKFMIKGLSELSEKVDNELLSNMFDQNISIREVHVNQLNKVFEIFERKATGKKSDAIHNFFGEASSFISDKTKGATVQEAGVVFATQKILHYNIANYSSLAALAEKMGKPDAADILNEALKNEVATGMALTKISENLMDDKLSPLIH